MAGCAAAGEAALVSAAKLTAKPSDGLDGGEDAKMDGVSQHIDYAVSWKVALVSARQLGIKPSDV